MGKKRVTVREAVAILAADIAGVRWGDCSDGQDRIAFTFRGEPRTGVLRGRNADLVLGGGAATDAAIALRVMLAGDAGEVST